MARRQKPHWSDCNALASECMQEIHQDGGSMVDAEGIARSILRRVSSPSPDGIADALEIEIVPTGSLPEGMRGLLLEPFPTAQPSLLRHQQNGDPQMTTLMLVVRSMKGSPRAVVVLHECAHHIYNRLRRAHTHGDVWRLTLALAFPRRFLREAWAQARGSSERAEILASLGSVPLWCAEARIEIESQERRPRRTI